MAKNSRATRTLMALGALSDCGTARALHHGGIDSYRALRGTEYEAGLTLATRVATARGVAFERKLREDDWHLLCEALGEGLGLNPDSFGISSQDADERRLDRWERTVRVIRRRLIEADATAQPWVIDSATIISRVTSKADSHGYVEADNLVLDPARRRLVVAETKSWPMIDGIPADPHAAGKALDQCAIYVVLLRREFEALGWDPKMISTAAMLVTPKNVGFRPIATTHELGDRIRRAEQLLENAETAAALEEALDGSVTDELITPLEAAPPEAPQRLAIVEALLERESSTFDPAVCSRSCGLVNLCHRRAYEDRRVVLLGSPAVRAVDGVETLTRVNELAAGAAPNAAEAETARVLRRATALLEAL